MKSLKSFVTAMAASAAVAGALSAPQQVQAAGSDPNTGNLTVEAGADFVTAYVFRGVVIENESLIYQPWITLKANVMKGDDSSFVKNVTIFGNAWASFHENSRTNYFEQDLTLGVSAEIDKATVSLYHVWYTYPGGTSAIHEFNFKLSYNDAGMWGEVMGHELSLMPYVLVAIEHGGGGGSDLPAGLPNHGIYFELGLAPTFALGDVAGSDYPVTLSIPMVLGLGSDYYEFGTSDDTFGFFSIGARATVPLNFIPSSYGAWSAYAGVTMYFLGDNAALIGGPTGNGIAGGDDFEVVGSVGVSMSY